MKRRAGRRFTVESNSTAASAAGEGALAGLRIVEIGDEKGVYCGRLLAAFGAEVIRVEPPGGDAARRLRPVVDTPDGQPISLPFFYWNAGKRSIVLDLALPNDRRRFLGLVQRSDVVVESGPPGWVEKAGVGFEVARRLHPALVWTSITDFGSNGPRAHWRGSDLVVGAAAGALFVTGYPEDPPVRLAGSQQYVMASVYGAVATLVAVQAARRSGRGQRVDLSAQEAVASVSHISGAGKYLDDGILPRRMGNTLFAPVPSGAYRCRDGFVYLTVNRPAHWAALAAWIAEVTGNRAVCDPLFEGPSANRIPYRELIDAYVNELTETMTMKEAFLEGQRRHIAITPVYDALQVLADPQLRSREFFVETADTPKGRWKVPRAPFRMSITRPRVLTALPRVGEDATYLEQVLSGPARGAGDPQGRVGGERDLPLAGLRVLEFGAGMAGPWVGRILAWCGAEVIKVESRQRPDVTRQYIPPRNPELGPQTQLSPWLTDWNAGKRFVAVNLRRPEGVRLVRRLASICDVVVENFAAGVLDRLGLGYAALRRRRRDIIMLSSSGFGRTGPYASFITWGPNIEAFSGLAGMSGFPHRDCIATQYAYPDAAGALHGLVAVLAALEYRRRTGQGQHIDLAQAEVTAACIGELLLEAAVLGGNPARRGNRSPDAAPQGCYPCRGDDRWIALTVAGEPEWEALCQAMNRADLASDPFLRTLDGRIHKHDEIDAAIANWTRDQDAFELAERLQRAGIAAAPVQNTDDLLRRDPQLAARKFHETIEHVVKGQVVASGIALGLTETPGRSGRTGADIGADNEYVFRQLLGVSDRTYRRLVREQVIETAA